MLTLKAFHIIIFIDNPIYTKNYCRKLCQSVTDLTGGRNRLVRYQKYTLNKTF